MGISVPIPTTIKERGVYQALLKIARAVSRSTIVTVVNSGNESVADQGAIGGGANFVLVDTIEVDTGILWVDYNRAENIYVFKSGFRTGDVVENGGGGAGDPSVYLNTVVKPYSYNPLSPTVRLDLEIYCRRIDSYANVTIDWKAQLLN